MIKNMKLGRKKRNKDLMTYKPKSLSLKKRTTKSGMISKINKMTTGNKNN